MADHDIHLSASAISEFGRRDILSLGFAQDNFSECRNCEEVDFHATYRGSRSLPDNALWDQAVACLARDIKFKGTLEEERELAKRMYTFQRDPGNLNVLRLELSPVPVQPCPPEIHKACDLHFGVRLDNLSWPTVNWIERLGVASFKKQRPDGPWRIWTITFEDMVHGQRMFSFLEKAMGLVAVTAAKIKLEKLNRFVRIPEDAPTLPITLASQVEKWLIQPQVAEIFAKFSLAHQLKPPAPTA